jgi:hypothetical protein
VLVEKTLARCIKEICVKLRLGLADWDLDSRLRQAIQHHTNFRNVATLVKQFDETSDMAVKSNIPIDPKFRALSKLKG